MTVKKLTVENLRKMVKEAVALQMKQSASERKAKMEADKEKSKEKDKVNESKTVKVTMEQLRQIVKEAVQAKLKENFSEMPQIGDLVAAGGKTGYIADTKMGPEGSMVAITKDGVSMQWVPASAVQVMAASDDLDQLSPEEIHSLDNEMGPIAGDPGEDPTAELGRIEGQLGNKLLAKTTRGPLAKRAGELKNTLGITDTEY